MKNEADFKSLFKKSVRAQKGFSLSLAAPTIAGIPDLYVIMPGYLPIMLEAKYLKDVNLTFKRKLQFTGLQRLWIEECHQITAYSAMGLIGFKYNDTPHAVMVAYGTDQFESLTHNFMDECAYVALDKTTRLFNVLDLFSRVPIPKVGEAKTQCNNTRLILTGLSAA